MKRKRKTNMTTIRTMIGIKKFVKHWWFVIGIALIALPLLTIPKPVKITNVPEVTQQMQQHVKESPFIPVEINIPVHLKFSATGGGFKVIPITNAKITAYNNVPQQTNEQPNIGASNRKVFVGSCAVSRDILRDYKVKYGDVLCIKNTQNCYFIEDTMNKRYDAENGKRVDIFMYDLTEAKSTYLISDIVILQQL